MRQKCNVLFAQNKELQKQAAQHAQRIKELEAANSVFVLRRNSCLFERHNAIARPLRKTQSSPNLSPFASSF
jgi:hypothetical protein